MFMILFSLAISTVLLLLFAGILYGGGRASAVAGVSLLALVTLFCTPLVAAQALLTLVFSAIAAPLKARPRTLFAGACAAMAGVYGIAALAGLAKWHELAELRKDYPVVALADRLAYEQQFAPRPAKDAEPVALRSNVAERLRQFEESREMDYYGRSSQLAVLHERTADAFAQVVGFGPVRMVRLVPGNVRLPETAPIPLPKPSREYSPDAEPQWSPPGPLAAAGAGAFLADQPERLEWLHESSVSDLLNPDRIGWVKERQQAAGFQSHAFTRLPVPVQSVDAEWQVVRLDLIGMWSHAEPVAYATEELPKMDELGKAPTRPLDQFEQAAVKELETDEDVVTEAAPGVIRMVGSLRAARDCLDCHSVRRGQLLGALSYELRPLGAPRPAVEPPADPQAGMATMRQVAQSR